MEDLSFDKISELMKSPDLMKNIQAVLGQLGDAPKEKPDIVVEEKNQVTSTSDAIEALGGMNFLSSIASFLSENKAERIALLTALRPFLGEEKKSVLDSILQILRAANILLATNMLK